MSYASINDRIKAAAGTSPLPQLIAVSKFQPASAVLDLYNQGHRHFGENYVQELVAKSKELPPDIHWHLIGHLQSNKAKVVKDVPNLTSIDSLDSLTLAKKLENQLDRQIDVYIQINVSDEPQKGGLPSSDLNPIKELLEHIVASPKLNLKGLMTIGSLSNVKEHSAKDFETLNQVKSALDSQYNLNLGLSMGMSADFEDAIKHGATCVRVGSLLFGERHK